MGYSATQLNPGAGGANVKQFTDSNSNVSQAIILQTQDGGSDPLPIGFTNPLPVQGGVADFAADIQNSIKVAGVYNASAPTASTGQRVPLQVDAAGNLKINIVAGAAAGGTSSNFNAAIPGTGTMVGASDGTNMKPILVDGSGNLKVNIAAGGVPAGQDNSSFTAGTTNGLPAIAIADNTNAISAITQGNQGILKMTTSRQLRVVVDGAATGGDAYFTLVAPATPAKSVLKASAGSIGMINVVNTNATPVYLKIWDNVTASVTLGTTAANLNFTVPGNTAGAGITIPLPRGLSLGTGIIIAVTNGVALTDNTAIPNGTSVTVNIGYT